MIHRLLRGHWCRGKASSSTTPHEPTRTGYWHSGTHSPRNRALFEASAIEGFRVSAMNAARAEVADDLDRLRAVERAARESLRLWGQEGMAAAADALEAALGDRAAEEGRCNRLYDHERGIPHGCNGL